MLTCKRIGLSSTMLFLYWYKQQKINKMIYKYIYIYLYIILFIFCHHIHDEVHNDRWKMNKWVGIAVDINTLMWRQNGCHFAEDNVRSISWMKIVVFFYLNLSKRFSWSALVQIMAWCRTVDRPLSVPMTNQRIGANICVIQCRWAKLHFERRDSSAPG